MPFATIPVFIWNGGNDMANVLLVDDAAEVLTPLAKMLKDGGHDVACVRNGLEALEALDDVTPDVVVTDIRMPVMDGVALLACALAASNGVPFEFVSTRATGGDARATG